METITITALFRDSATEGITRLEGSLGRMGSRLRALNDEMGSRAQSALGGFKSNLNQLGSVVEGVSKKLDPLIERVGQKLWSATKIGVAGAVGLGVAFGAMAMTIEKEVANAQVTIGNFLGAAPNSARVQTMVENMHSLGFVASLQAQTTGMQQLLVNPLYASQATSLSPAIAALAERNPMNSEALYSKLTNVVGRAEQLGRVNPRATIMLGQAGISTTDLAQMFGFTPQMLSTPQGMRAFQGVMSKSMPVGEFLQYIRTTAQRQAGWDPNHPFALATSEQTAINNSPTVAMAYAKNTISMTVAQSLKDMNFGKLIMDNIAPVQSAVSAFAKNVVPPLVGFMTSLLRLGSALIPVVAPLMNAFSGALANGINHLARFMPQLQSLGKGLGTAFSRFLTASLPMMPALVQGLIGLLNVLPPFLQILTVVMYPLSRFLVVLTKLLDVITSNSGVAYTIAGIATGLIAIAAAGKVLGVLDGIKKWMKDVEGTSGFWNKIKTITGTGGAKGTQEVAKSTVAEMTVTLMKVTEMIGGPGGGGLPGGKGVPGEPSVPGESQLPADLEKGAAGGFFAKTLGKIPFLRRLAGPLDRALAWTRGKIPGLGGGSAAGDAASAVAPEAGGSVAAGLALPAAVAATGAAVLGYGFYTGINPEGPGTGNAVQGLGALPPALEAKMEAYEKIHGPGSARDMSPYMALKNLPDLKGLAAALKGWEKADLSGLANLTPAQLNADISGAGTSGATVIHVHGDVKVQANDANEFTVSMQKWAAAQARRGARNPANNQNQSAAHRILAGRPSS